MLCNICFIFDIGCDSDIAAALLEQSQEGMSERVLDDIVETVFKITIKTLLTKIYYSINGGSYVFTEIVKNYKKDTFNYDEIFESGENIANDSNGNVVETNNRQRIIATNKNLAAVMPKEVVFILEEVDGISSKSSASAAMLLRCLYRVFYLEMNLCHTETGKAVMKKCQFHVVSAINILEELQSKEDGIQVNFTNPKFGSEKTPPWQDINSQNSAYLPIKSTVGELLRFVAWPIGGILGGLIGTMKNRN